MEELFQNDNQSTDNEYMKKLRQESAEIFTENDIDFKINEVEYVVKNLKKNKSPGIDKITNEIFIKVFEVIPKEITTLFNKCLNYGYFPEEWKVAIIKVFLKSKTKPKDQVSSYRPISLLPTIAKVLEKLIIERINYYLLKKNLLSDKQFGFTKQKSTETAIEYLISKAKNQLKKRAFLLIVSLDIRGAFDNCVWPAILKQLRNKNCPKNLYNVIKSYLQHRKVILKINNLKVEKYLTKSTPQGSSLGPGIWNIFCDSLWEINTNSQSEIICFCDDTMLLVYGHDIEQIEKSANDSLIKINESATNMKLEFSADKTTAILITRRTKHKKPVIKLNDKLIEIKNEINYLGIIIDKKLLWESHINYITDKAIINSLKTIINCSK